MPRLLLALLWVVALLNYLDRQILYSLLPVVRTELQLTDPQMGMLGAAFLWVYAVSSLFAGWAAERFGHRNVILWSLLAWSGITALTGASDSFGALAATRGAMGLAEAFYIPAALAMVAAAFPERNRSLAVSVHQSGIYAGILLGGGPGAAMGSAFGWRAIYFGLGAVGIAYALLLVRWLPSPSTRTHDAPRYAATVAAVTRSKGFWPIFAVFAAVSFAHWMVLTWMPLYLYDRFRFSMESAGYSATLFTQVSGVSGVVWGGWLADRLSRVRPRGRILTQRLGLAPAGVFLLSCGAASSAPVLLAALLLYSFGRGVYDGNVMPVLCEVVPEHLRSTAYGLLNFAGTLIGGVAALGTGMMRQFIGLEGALIGAGFVVLASSMLLAWIPGHTPERAVLSATG